VFGRAGKPSIRTRKPNRERKAFGFDSYFTPRIALNYETASKIKSGRASYIQDIKNALTPNRIDVAVLAQFAPYILGKHT
jgi:hypothetical protein